MTATTGLIAGISDDEYHGTTASLSSTGARKLLDCPARFRWEQTNPPEPRAAFDFGKLAHGLVLGEGGVIRVIDAPDWRTKAAQAERDQARADGETPVLRAEYNAAVAMREVVMAHPTASALFADGSAELSGYWDDEATGIRLRFRPDWMTSTLSGRPLCIDYKTSVSANPAEFASSVGKFGYHMQHAWYVDGLAANGIEDAAFLFVVQEKQPPYPVSVIELHADAVALGARRNRRAIDLYAQCLADDTWPAYGIGVTTIDLPRWVYSKQEGETA